MEQPTTVLVVDDEADIAALMRDFLEAEGYAVVTAHDGPAALDALASGPVDCVLLDVMMPGQSGFEVLRRIRDRGDVPVLFLSARQEDRTRSAASASAPTTTSSSPRPPARSSPASRPSSAAPGAARRCPRRRSTSGAW